SWRAHVGDGTDRARVESRPDDGADLQRRHRRLRERRGHRDGRRPRRGQVRASPPIGSEPPPPHHRARPPPGGKVPGPRRISRRGALLPRVRQHLGRLALNVSSAHPLRILVVSTFNPGDANMLRDYLFSFNAYSRHRYYYVFNRTALENNTDFSAFDVILIFWSVFLPGPELPRVVRARIREAPAVKVAFLQDEYREVRTINAAMRELGIQIVFTLVAEADHETFFPRSLVPTLEATYHVLPGYVPAYLEGVPCPAPGTRPVDVGYRSREQPYYLGDLGREKTIIAERFRAICE